MRPLRCALCLEDKELRESHIIPEFMFTSMYDGMHRFQVLSDKQSNKYAQKGLRQKLLCARCEQQIGRYERYVSLLMRGELPLKAEPHQDFVLFRGVDYKALRLFQLSVLWRASICELEFFSQVSLGPHNERIRQLLASEDPGKPWQYGCLMFAAVHEGAAVQDLMVAPGERRLAGVPCYRFLFGGHFWLYLVANHQHFRKIETASLSPSGELRIRTKEVSEVKSIADLSRLFVDQRKV